MVSDAQQRALGTPAHAAGLVVAGIHDEPAQPSVEAIRVTQPGDLAPCPDERLLGCILGAVGVVEDEAGEGVEASGRHSDEHREGIVVAAHGFQDVCGAHGRSSDLPAPSVTRWRGSTVQQGAAGAERDARGFVGSGQPPWLAPRGCHAGTPGRIGAVVILCCPLPSAFITTIGRFAIPRAWRSRRNTIFLPSGDQVGPQSSPVAQGVGSAGPQPLIWCWLLPLAFITQTPPLPNPPAWNTIFEPSGLQSGTWSCGTGLFVSACWCCPSESMIQTC